MFMMSMELKALRPVRDEELETWLHTATQELALRDSSKCLGTPAQVKPEFVTWMLKRIPGLWS